MVGLNFFFVFLIQFIRVGLALAFIYVLVVHPDAIGATVANIIVGFQTAMKGGA